MSQRSYAKAKGRQRKQSFVGFPRPVIEHHNFDSLSGNATKLLVQLNGQYKGFNNGDLSCEFSKMQGKGWRSKATLNRALQELVSKGFVVMTRQGHFPSTCSLYAVTWQAIDECKGQHDYTPSKTPLNWWRTGGEPKLKSVA